jgi:hypothetical protein
VRRREPRPERAPRGPRVDGAERPVDGHRDAAADPRRDDARRRRGLRVGERGLRSGEPELRSERLEQGLLLVEVPRGSGADGRRTGRAGDDRTVVATSLERCGRPGDPHRGGRQRRPAQRSRELVELTVAEQRGVGDEQRPVGGVGKVGRGGPCP